YRVVIEAGPSVLPSIKVRDPVRDVDVDPIDSRARDLPHALHVSLAPLAGIRTHPYVFIAFPDPKRRAPAEDCRLARDLPLQPVRMLFRQRVRRRVRIRRYAFRARDVYEGAVARPVRLFR